MELHLKTIGVLLLLLSCVHIAFPRYFNWANELKSLSLVNRQMIYVHTFFIALILLLMGLLCFLYPKELITTFLGRRIAMGLALFWSARLLIQFFGYSSKLWKAKRFETGIHVLFSILWMYFSIVLLMVGSGQYA